MKRTLLTLPVLVLAACGGGGGSSSPLVGDWEGDATLEYTVDDEPGSTGGFQLVTVESDGDRLVVDDSVCAYPAQASEDGETLTFLALDDGCVRDLGFGPMNLAITEGSGSMNGDYLNLAFEGTASAVSGSATGTFSWVFRGQPYSGSY